ncbi:transglycosylase SLT domain-containing protein [Nocardia harenae]|uniref:transglycosylase SLT domain-containing protein n=1 Tax=Nocardia harenae TaxID=358707 RepID=UPI000831A23C|nr:transglycosylase SLT domain-containing protein [Nocardia harenae]
MTLTVDDVAAWLPEQLTAAGDAAARIQRDLDAALGSAVTDTAALTWSGATAAAATARVETEKTRGSAVSAALLELRTAFTQQVTNLTEARAKVVALRDDALNQPAPMGPYGVAPDGTVDATARIAYLRGQSHLVDVDGLVFQEALQAASRSWNLTQALRTAESTATTAQTAIDRATGALRAAYDGLGDPALNVPAAAPTAPAAPASSTAAPVSSSSGTTSHSSNGSETPSGTGSGTPQYAATGSMPTGPMPTGDQAEWIRQAIEVLRAQGYDVQDSDAAIIAMIIEKESGGNPQAINLWDSNAAAGIPSKGLMQTIDPTFDAYKVAGHDDIWNPVDNIIAGSRYAIERYGSLSNVPGIVAMSSGQGYRGY